MTDTVGRTLLIIKPDAVERNLAGEILQRVMKARFAVVQLKQVRLDPEQAMAFYAVHKGKPFFEGLVEYMSSGDIMPLVVEKDNAVVCLRQLVGATDPAEAVCGTIRHDYGLNVQRNSVHASDAEDTAAKEIAFFFPELAR